MSSSQPDTDSITTLSAHLDHLASLNAEAKDLMPYKVDECSFAQGYVRQKVWSCRTCAAAYGRSGEGKGVGVCYACSVSCHAEHDLVELFVRRSFRCDCLTLPQNKCTLFPSPPTTTSTSTSSSTSPPRPILTNPKNKYTRNFAGQFCRCERGKTYDPLTEAESMVECLGCEDWFHESCLNLQDPLNPTPPHETTSNTSSTSSSSSENESPILPSSTYSHLICSSCIVSNPLLTRYAGTEGWMMVVPSLSPSPRDEEQTTTMEWKDKWRVIGRREDISVDGVKHELVEQDKAVGEKRKGLSSPSSPSPSSLYNPAAKRTKIVVDSSSGPPSTTTDSPNTPAAVAAVPVSVCTAPPPNPTAQAIIHALLVTGTNPVSSTTAAASLKTNVEVEAGVGVKGDVFLQEGARESICTCPRCAAGVEGLPFPLVEEEEYEPEMEDTPDPTEEELTDKALSVLPRSQAIEGLLRFNAMKDRLKEFLEPFREGGKVVCAADIEEFMDSIKNRE